MGQVLVVDDEPIIRNAIGRLLVALPCTVSEAPDGVAALAMVRALRYDLVLTDLRMPRMDGFALLRTIKAEQPETPVVMLTASGLMSDCMTAMRDGAVNFLTKPFHQDDLREVVRRCLSKDYCSLKGFITERHFDLAEEEFPGITRFYAARAAKPATFLDLVRLFEQERGCTPQGAQHRIF